MDETPGWLPGIPTKNYCNRKELVEMKALRLMNNRERKFAEQNHDLVLEFLRHKHLSKEDYYDVIIFGYLTAVQQYLRNPPDGVSFQAMAYRNMKDTLYQDMLYHTRKKRTGTTVSLDRVDYTVAAQSQSVEQKTENKILAEQTAHIATPKEADILQLIVDGYTLREIARHLHIPTSTVTKRMNALRCRAQTAIG